MLRNVPRHVVVALVLVPVFWLAAWWTSFRATVEIEGTESGVRFSLDGQTMEHPDSVGRLRGITVVATQHFFPTGGTAVTISGANGLITERFPLPRRFPFPALKAPLASDWWIDYGNNDAEWALPPVDIPTPWRVRATFTGRGQAGLKLEGDGGRTITCGFRAGGYDNDLYVLDASGKPVAATPVVAKFGLDAKHILNAMMSAGLLASLLIVVFCGLSFVARRWHWPLSSDPPSSGLMVLILASAVVLSLWVGGWVLDARPHFQDDLGYLLRAKWLLTGHLDLPKPAQAEHFGIPFTLVVGDRWISQYPIGWPALLALGQALNRAWIVSPLCSAVTVFAAWRIGREVYGNTVGLAGALLLTLSPLWLMLSGSMLSHAAASMWLALFLWLFLRGWRGKGSGRNILLAGLALGFAFSTRPLSGLAVGAVAGIFVLTELKHRRFSRAGWRLLALLFVGGVVGSLPALIDNWMVTGRPLTFAYNLNYPTVWSLKAYDVGTFWVDRNLALFSTLAFGWGWPWLGSSWLLLTLPFALALVPFLTARANRFDWLLLGMFAILPIAFVGYNYGGLHGFGPRYYIDTLFALTLLIARGFHTLAKEDAAHGRSPLPRIAAVLLFVAVTAGTATTLVRRLSLYRGYNWVDDRIEQKITAQSIKRGLILLEPPAYLNWVRAGRLLSPDLRANLVFAEKLDDNSALLRAYAGWPVYVVDDESLRPYSPSP
jgi:4-amino-4-deoxy-L-arabinose transferase-like glycosyltransferase